MHTDGTTVTDRTSVKASKARSPLGCLTWMVVLSLLVYGGCTWDGYVADYRFEKLCNEPGAVGQFIYEKEPLEETNFVHRLSRLNDAKETSRYELPDGSLIDDAMLKKRYEIVMYDRITISSVGPIDYIRSSITRTSDGKLLSEARSYYSFGGKSKNAWSLGYWQKTCPPLVNPEEEQSEFYRIHENLVRNTFFKLTN